jgi:parvulin-like peptidyl-prolyl isomerase
MRTYILPLAAIAAAALSLGCEQPAAPATAAAAKPPPPPSTAPSDETVAIRVNGQPIYQRQLVSLLMQGYGLGVAQQLIANELIRQEAAANGIAVTDADVQLEHRQTLQQMFPQVEGPEQRERLFAEWLARKAFPYEQWEMTMRRNALLTRLAAQQVKVTDEMVRAEFDNAYGRQVRVRHIEVESLDKAQEIIAQLAKGEDFEKLARTRSLNVSGRESGGLLPPMAANTPDVPAAILQVALAMSKVGEVSDPVKVFNSWHILKLQEIIPPKGMKFEEVKDRLAAQAYERQMQQVKQRLLLTVIQQADARSQIEYVDPILRAANKEAMRQAEANRQ